MLPNLHRRVQYLLGDSSLNEGPRVRLYHLSDSGAVLGSSLDLLAIVKESFRNLTQPVWNEILLN